jgi:hypothetical protein
MWWMGIIAVFVGIVALIAKENIIGGSLLFFSGLFLGVWMHYSAINPALPYTVSVDTTWAYSYNLIQVEDSLYRLDRDSIMVVNYNLQKE